MARRVKRSLTETPRERAVREWLAAGNDRTLRLDYELGPESLVMDLGGYEGQWASDIHSRYRCPVWVFEPVPTFADAISRRFARNDAISVYDFGLAGSTRTERLAVAGDASSVYAQGAGTVIDVELRDVARFFEEHSVEEVSLMKVNIEGGEYELLRRLHDTGLIGRIVDIQVQFHDFVSDARAAMQALRSRLAETHVPTYQVDFVWENWHRIAS